MLVVSLQLRKKLRELLRNLNNLICYFVVKELRFSTLLAMAN